MFYFPRAIVEYINNIERLNIAMRIGSLCLILDHLFLCILPLVRHYCGEYLQGQIKQLSYKTNGSGRSVYNCYKC